MNEQLRNALEGIAASWDGCEYDTVGETLNIGAQLRKQFAALSQQAAQQPQPVDLFAIFEAGWQFHGATKQQLDGRDVGRLTASEFWPPMLRGMHVGTDLHVGLTVGEAVVRLKQEIKRRLDGYAAAPVKPADIEQAHRWATELAVSMARKFYPDVPQFEPLPDLVGVISQIDNMTTGLVRAKPAEQEKADNCGNCETCRPITMDDMRMVLCTKCGNKRCPHATDHRNACANSNEPGQPGSSHPALKLLPAEAEQEAPAIQEKKNG